MFRTTLLSLGVLAVLGWASAAEASDPSRDRDQFGAATTTLGYSGDADTELAYYRGGYGGYRGGYYGGYGGYRGSYGGYYGGYRGGYGGYGGYRGGYGGYYRPYYSGYGGYRGGYGGYYGGYGGYRGGYGGYRGGYGSYYRAIGITEEDDTEFICHRPVVVQICPQCGQPLVNPAYQMMPRYQAPVMPQVPATVELRPYYLPQNGPQNGGQLTFPYDGGPTNPVPMPAGVQPAAPQVTPAYKINTPQTPARFVSLPSQPTTQQPQPTRFAYPAYGESPTNFATQRPK